MATGVLLVCIGKATKIVELLTSDDKEYLAEAKLGLKTDTYDITGDVLEEKGVPKDLEINLEKYEKTYLQEVPIYSATKVNGKKLYEYARNNKEIDLPKKEVTIKKIELLDYSNNTITFKALVSKGCYIRSLINEIGNDLNTYAVMTKLERIKQGNINISDTNTLEDIENNNYVIHSIEEVLEYPIVEVDEELEKLISNGVRLNNSFNITDRVIFKSNNKLLGVYEVKDNKLIVWKNFN